MGQSFRGLTHTPHADSLRDPGPPWAPTQFHHLGKRSFGEGTGLEEDDGIRGFVLWTPGLGGSVDSLTHLSLSALAAPPPPPPGIEMDVSFLIQGMGKMRTGPASTGRGAGSGS